MKHRSKYYKIKVEEISDRTVKFLEVRVWKHGSRFVTGPEFKPTSLWQPLGADSAHAPHCHMSWPGRAPHHLSCAVGNTSHLPESQTGIDQQVYLALCTRSPSSKTSEKSTVLLQSDVVPSSMEHPVVYRNLRHALVRFQASSEMLECHERAFSTKCPRIRIAWKNDMPLPQVHHQQNVQADREHRASGLTPLSWSN